MQEPNALQSVLSQEAVERKLYQTKTKISTAGFGNKSKSSLIVLHVRKKKKKLLSKILFIVTTICLTTFCPRDIHRSNSYINAIQTGFLKLIPHTLQHPGRLLSSVVIWNSLVKLNSHEKHWWDILVKQTKNPYYPRCINYMFNMELVFYQL